MLLDILQRRRACAALAVEPVPPMAVLGDEVVQTGFEIKRMYTLFLYRYHGTGYTT